MRLPQQPNFRTLLSEDVKGSEVRSALQWMWQELVKAINQNDSEGGTGGSELSWDLLTNGDISSPELLFAGAEVIWVNIP